MIEPEERAPRPGGVVEVGQSVEAITLDFGNTLVAFPARSFGNVLAATAQFAADACGVDTAQFIRIWNEERLRQFEHDVPNGREADMNVRAARVLARLRGCPWPPPEEDWPAGEIGGWSSPQEIEGVLEAYASAFVRLTPVPREIEPILARLAERYSLAILSNWPIATAVERFVDAAGWSVDLKAVVISQRVGAIKPRPEMFRAGALALGLPSGRRLLHVGDDLGADIAGAHAVGWLAGWVRFKPEDLPLPVAPSVGDERPDLVLDRIADLPRALGLASRRTP